MESSSDRSSALSSVQQHSSSHPPCQAWSNQYISTFGPRGRVFNPALEDPALSRRTNALRQLHGTARPPQRKHRQTPSTPSRASLPLQPVIVRTYSPSADGISAMARRAGSETARQATSGPKLPLVEEFGIEGILQAIEPNIQVTLDAIAEICGRSRLSLANEYGSHRPPLGEIRAQARTNEHGLLTVEEASSSNERLADDSIAIMGDDISTVDGHRHYSSAYDYLNPINRPTGLFDLQNSLSQVWAETNSTQHRVEGQNPRSRRESLPIHEETNLPIRHPAVEKGRLPYLPWALDTSNGETSHYNASKSMMTRAVISEVHLDAQADRVYHLSEPDRPLPSADPTIESPDSHGDSRSNRNLLESRIGKLSVFSEIHDLLGWFGHLGRSQGTKSSSDVASLVTAQTRLQELLERHNAHLSKSSSQDT